ncbi:MAG: PepSY domain-containing protein [Edaphobacter sp.]
MSRKHAFLHYTRYTHLYLGVFIAPALLFFAFTGALQTFSFHETTRGSSYKPPTWIATLAQIHKKQTMTVPVRKLPPLSLQAAGPKADELDKADRTGRQNSEVRADQAERTDRASSEVRTDKADRAQTPDVPAKSHNPLPLKFFFLLVSIGLFLSTLSGLYMSYRYSRNRILITGLLIAGIVIPIALLYL